MGKYLGYLVIILIHFGIKGCQYSEMEKTTGVVVEERSFAYGRMSGRGGRDVVPYPVVKFKGPVTQKEVRKVLYKPEEHTSKENTARGIDRSNNTTSWTDTFALDSVADMSTEELIEMTESRYKAFESTYVETDEYLTETPWGAYFFKHFDTGEEMPVIYDRRYPENGVVYSFFSFWLHLRAVCFILLACIIWTGLYRIAKGQVT